MQQVLWLALLGVVACSEPHKAPSEVAEQPSATPASMLEVSFDSTKVHVLRQQTLPADLPKMPGSLVEAWQWQDANGENVLIITRRGPLPEKNTKYTDEESYVELFARQYKHSAGRWQEVWQLQDNVRNCPFDMWLGPFPGATSITDLDHDGKTETTLVYKLTCRSDVSPSNMKLIMREGNAKYALRGQTVVQYDSVPVSQRAPANPCCLDTFSQKELDAPYGYELYAGRYETEKEFRTAPPAFMRFARQQWRKWSVRDTFEQL